MKTVLVIAPHADDETLGCGGTLLKMKAAGDRLGWLLATSPTPKNGFPVEFARQREQDIRTVKERYGFSFVEILDFPPGGIAETPRKKLVEELSRMIEIFKPHTVFLPFEGDVHSDHRAIFESCQSALKTFRAPDVERILCYETISESDQSFRPSFIPNVFVNISDFLEEKIDIMNTYSSEIAHFPFPRSREAIEALAHLRGAQAGFAAAEAFMLMRERVL